MNTIKAFTAEDATVIVGTVIDENMADQLRVTMVATGLGQPVERAQPKPLTVVKTGTDAGPVDVVDYAQLETPAVIRRRNRESTIEAIPPHCALKMRNDSRSLPVTALLGT